MPVVPARAGPAHAESHWARGIITSMRELAQLCRDKRTVVLTGAGCSTESGIPDYRGKGTLRRARSPMLYRTFVDDAAARRRYWARSCVGWPRFAAAAPNAAHQALVRLESSGAVRGVITQNVDRLHARAGSRRVVELHGALERVRCLGCGARTDRAKVQERLLSENPGWEAAGRILPDGDVELGQRDPDGFRIVDCDRCGGVLKPDVVFFGECVPPRVVADAWSLFDEAEVLLVVGSSLAVFSGYRFVRAAAERGIPVALINLGETRGDSLAKLRIAAAAGEALPALSHALGTEASVDQAGSPSRITDSIASQNRSSSSSDV